MSILYVYMYKCIIHTIHVNVIEQTSTFLDWSCLSAAAAAETVTFFGANLCMHCINVNVNMCIRLEEHWSRISDANIRNKTLTVSKGNKILTYI